MHCRDRTAVEAAILVQKRCYPGLGLPERLVITLSKEFCGLVQDFTPPALLDEMNQAARIAWNHSSAGTLKPACARLPHLANSSW